MSDVNEEGAGTGSLDAGSYEVVKQRLIGHVAELTKRAGTCTDLMTVDELQHARRQG